MADYAACIEDITGMFDEIEEGSESHDTCLHLLGGSCYYAGKYEKAQPLLDRHVALYPKSRFTKFPGTIRPKKRPGLSWALLSRCLGGWTGMSTLLMAYPTAARCRAST
ncbi:MAG: hypothetical protein K9M97_05325 [Akkermansiaceae bacterium]|nr:hypothetical protein [Akkermansiaceae bacterium]